jgi:hypothetical protein
MEEPEQASSGGSDPLTEDGQDRGIGITVGGEAPAGDAAPEPEPTEVEPTAAEPVADPQFP